MNKHPYILAKGRPEFTTLYFHLEHVRLAAIKFARELKLDVRTAELGAIFHDIGKACRIFQLRLDPNYIHTSNELPFRHELASLFFLSLVDEKYHPQIIEMIISHHKSFIYDKRERGILDLIDNYGFQKVFEMHSSDFEVWSEIAMDILECFGIERKKITLEDARNNLIKAVEYVRENALNKFEYSEWKGLLMGADHFASSLSDKTEELLKPTFKVPNLSYYHGRKSEYYPLSNKKSISNKKHTIVSASTGAGKTDFLLRRCKGRVFYTLPFTASINAMYERFKKDMKSDDNDLDIRVLHSSSKLQEKNGARELRQIQSQFGASVKVLTPHQMTGIVFGVNGYEAMLLDMKGCDVILDEIHTYSDKFQGIVLKIVEMLKHIECRIHIGTATLPKALYDEILKILGEENVYQVKLTKKEMKSFDRHKIIKHPGYDKKLYKVIKISIKNNEKVLIVRNRVSHAQHTYQEMKKLYPNIPVMLIHSRYKRGRRNELEKKLLELNNLENTACIVISTQVVEVSLDISFDLEITDCAPIDALIQRFGRINRIRNANTIGKYKKIYVLAPPTDKKDAMPYSLDVLIKTYEILPNRRILREHEVQQLIDLVYPDIRANSVDAVSIFENGEFNSLYKLQHNSKSVMYEELGISSTNVILDTDVEIYINGNSQLRTMLEIPVGYHSISNLGLSQLEDLPHRPFIIPSAAYSDETGLNMEMLKLIGNLTII